MAPTPCNTNGRRHIARVDYAAHQRSSQLNCTAASMASMVFYDSTVDYNVRRAGGLGTTLMGGEGIFWRITRALAG